MSSPNHLHNLNPNLPPTHNVSHTPHNTLPSISTLTTQHLKSSAESLFSTQLASALSTFSDSQYFQDSTFSPSEIRQSLSTSDPSNPSHTPTILRGMKWLLASMSKGRTNVSDFFPHVVKLVSCPNLEIRKMVYMYLVHYADHDTTCRELALLSINAFQRGLGDKEQWIRALALRVLTSIRVMDVLQIQILAVETCGQDHSPYVRKCAAIAIAKLYPRVVVDNNNNNDNNGEEQKRLITILVTLLDKEVSTMVLSSVLCSFSEICGGKDDNFHLLHKSYRKICHLLTDMEEWAQIVIMDLMTRYCRMFFKRPEDGSASLVDKERRVVRKLCCSNQQHSTSSYMNTTNGQNMNTQNSNASNWVQSLTTPKNTTSIPSSNTFAGRNNNHHHQNPTKVKRRVVKKAFYSDEEDESGEEEVYINPTTKETSPSLATAMRERNVLLGFGSGISGIDHNNNTITTSNMSNMNNSTITTNNTNKNELEGYEALDSDHQLLLKSSLPLLKSRNAGVVLSTCSLHYYCGVSSIYIRSMLGKALVRIYHDRREIQYVVLNSIRMLVWECPSAFTPYLNDFFVKAMDPSFTRLIKLDILTALALEPNSIKAVLDELRFYIRHDDKTFVCASIRSVGKIAEMARIVHDRQGYQTNNVIKARDDANVICLNCLHGILSLSECSTYGVVVAECISVMQQILSLLLDGYGSNNGVGFVGVKDPNRVQSKALRQLILFLVRSLSSVNGSGQNDDENDDNDDDEMNEKNITKDPNTERLEEQVMLLSTDQVAPALRIVSEWLCLETQSSSSSYSLELLGIDKNDKDQIHHEILRLITRSFPDLKSILKCHGVHFASKSRLLFHKLGKSSSNAILYCEQILAMGRVDIDKDVRDRSRYESHILHMVVGLKVDPENITSLPPTDTQKITVENATSILLKSKPSSSWIPIEKEVSELGKNNLFRFGTLSSMISHKAGMKYAPLPPWAGENSPKSLRDPPPVEKIERRKITNQNKIKDGWNVDKRKPASDGFYDSDESSSESSSASSDEESSSSDDSSSYSSESSDSDSSSSEDESSDSDDSDDDDTDESVRKDVIQNTTAHTGNLLDIGNIKSTSQKVASPSSDDDSSGDESDTSDDDDESSSTSSEILLNKNENVGSLIDTKSLLPNSNSQPTYSVSTVAEGLQGLVMAPLVLDKNDANHGNSHENEFESSEWKELVRPDLSGGLSVMARFLRHQHRDREAKLLGLDPNNLAVVCVEMKFENRRTDGRRLRRIKTIQRSISTNGTIPTTRVVLPPEIGELKESQASTVTLGLEFANSSDKDGEMLSRFEIKCDRSSMTVDIRPELVERLIPCSMNISSFLASEERHQGIHQRSVATFNIRNESDSDQDKLKYLSKKILKGLNLCQVKDTSNKSIYFAGRLPLSGADVLVTVTFDNQTAGCGQIVVCCDSTMALNIIVQATKQAISASNN